MRSKMNELVKERKNMIIKLRKTNKENEYKVFVCEEDENGYLYGLLNIKRKIKTLKDNTSEMIIDGVKINFTMEKENEVVNIANVISFK